MSILFLSDGSYYNASLIMPIWSPRTRYRNIITQYYRYIIKFNSRITRPGPVKKKLTAYYKMWHSLGVILVFMSVSVCTSLSVQIRPRRPRGIQRLCM